MLVQKRYCDYDYDNNMIILFGPQDEERRSDDQLDIYWISCGNESLEDIPIPQTRTPPKKRSNRPSYSSTTSAPRPTALCLLTQEAKINKTRAQRVKTVKLKKKLVRKKQQSQHLPANRYPHLLPMARPPPIGSPGVPTTATRMAVPIAPYGAAAGYKPFPGHLANAIPTGPVPRYY